MGKNRLQDIIDILRGKKLPLKELSKNNNIDIPKKLLKNITLEITGKNNTIRITPPLKNNHIHVVIFGDNNEITINENVAIGKKLSIRIGFNFPNHGKANNTKFIIGKNTSLEEVEYMTYNSNVFCEIGDSCMLSHGIKIYNTDAHPIFDLSTKKLINKVKGIKIGNNSWIGMNSVILKNSIIPDWSILGCNTVFSGKKFTKTNCIFAGNPARMVKENVYWDANGAKCGYIENLQE